MHRFFFVVTALFLILRAEALSQTKKPPQFTVAGVAFSGNESFHRDSLLQVMAMRPPGFLSSTDFQPDLFAADLKNIIAFYQDHGYLQAAVVDTHLVYHQQEQTVDIHIGLQEGGRTLVGSIGTRGNTVFPDTLLLRMVGLAPGDPFLRLKIQTGMVDIIALYADSGYLDATALPEVTTDMQTHRASITLAIAEHVRRIVSDIRINGLKKTKTYVVQRELEFREGEVVRYSALLETQQRLYQTGVFQSVFIHPVPAGDSLSPATIIRIDLTEKLSGEFSVAVGYGSVEKVMGRIDIINNNFLGTARRVSVTAEANFIRQGLEGAWAEPWTFGLRWETDINPFFQYLIEPSYDLRRYGGIVTVGRSIGKSAHISASYRYQDATLIDVRTTELPQDYTPSVRSLVFSYTDDTRDDIFDPTKGYFIELTGEMAGAFLQGKNTFARTIGRVRGFYPPDQKTVLASSFQIGWMDFFGASNSIPINERFFAGGPVTLRGFAYQMAGPLDVNGNPLGGQFMIVWNLLEARRTLYKMFGLAAFVDVGNVWSRLRDFRPDDIRIGAGPGLRVNSPIGVIRIDYGINVYPQQREPKTLFYFSLGQAF